MEDADSSEASPREADGADGAANPARSAAAAASGTTGEAAAGAEPADQGHDAGDEKEGGADAGSTEAPKDPVVQNLERLLQERRDQRKQTTALRKEFKKAQKQKARIRKMLLASLMKTFSL